MYLNISKVYMQLSHHVILALCVYISAIDHQRSPRGANDKMVDRVKLQKRKQPTPQDL
jgi:hypothetical protein